MIIILTFRLGPVTTDELKYELTDAQLSKARSLKLKTPDADYNKILSSVKYDFGESYEDRPENLLGNRHLATL